MNSGQPITTPASATTPISLRQIRIFTAIYIAILIAVGVVTFRTDEDLGIPLSLNAAFIPAILYALAVFPYGQPLLLPAASEVRTRAWRHWVWLSAILSACSFPAILVSTQVLRTNTLSNFSQDFRFFPWLMFTSVVLPLLLVWIGLRAFLTPTSSSKHTPSRSRAMLALSLMAGGLLVLSSVVLHAGYEARGWEILAWRSPVGHL